MKIRISKRTKQFIIAWLILAVALYVIIYVLPKVTDVFETTEILKQGNIVASCETKGYLVKEEAVGMAPDTGKFTYLIDEGTAIKKGTTVISMEPVKNEKKPGYGDFRSNLKDYKLAKETTDAQISGIFSTSIDGNEQYFSFKNLDHITRAEAESHSSKYKNLDRKSAIKSEPVFKVTQDNKWYILCWLDNEEAADYEEGQTVIIQLPEDDVEATIDSIKKADNGGKRVTFCLNVFYSALATTRSCEMTIVTSDNSGLLLDNKCIIEKHGQQGVYIVNKNGAYEFRPINVIATDGKQSVVSDTTFFDEDGNQHYTVNVYDEVLKKPNGALKDDLKSEEKDD